MKRYQIIFRGMLAEAHLTHVKAKARAFELAKEKGWPIDEIQVKDTLKEASQCA